jgi:hypothetical protein
MFTALVDDYTARIRVSLVFKIRLPGDLVHIEYDTFPSRNLVQN